MAFSDFKYPDVVATFGLNERVAALFAGVPPVPLGAFGQLAVNPGARLGLLNDNEKARSEYIVAPLLADLWARYDGRIGLYSGVEFVADPDAELNGRCDFLIGTAPQLPQLRAPLAVVFEAKNDSISGGYGQCISAMVGIQRYNRRDGREVPTVYGCVTTGTNWKFLTLAGSALTFDAVEYALSQADRILGILVHMIGPIPE